MALLCDILKQGEQRCSSAACRLKPKLEPDTQQLQPSPGTKRVLDLTALSDEDEQPQPSPARSRSRQEKAASPTCSPTQSPSGSQSQRQEPEDSREVARQASQHEAQEGMSQSSRQSLPELPIPRIGDPASQTTATRRQPQASTSVWRQRKLHKPASCLCHRRCSGNLLT